MPTLDRYIIRQYLINFAILLGVLMTLFVLVDFVATMDEFVQAARRHAHDLGGFLPALVRISVDYYWPVVIRLFVMVCGLVVVGAMGFTYAAMARQGELTAVLTGGVSLYRLAAPVLGVAIALNLLLLPIQEFVIPPLAGKLVRDKTDLKREAYRSYTLAYLRDQNGSLLTAQRFIPGPGTPTMQGVTVLVRDPNGKALKRIRASQALWDADHQVWTLVNGYAVEPALGRDRTLAAQPPEPVIQSSFETSLTPEVILARRASAYPRLVSIHQLLVLAANASVDRPLVTHIMHSRFSGVVVNVLILLLGLPFFLVRRPANLVMLAFYAAAACITAWGFGLMLSFYSVPALNPVASAWLAVVILLPISAISLQFIET
ncbi:MAG: LptF/LptG family permease [Phycisphaeraceae bacterium]|nr:LptF/LptG family permease [Phycisphaeraceae bacterium]